MSCQKKRVTGTANIAPAEAPKRIPSPSPTVRHAALRQMLACYVVQLAEVGGIFQSGIQGSMWDKSDGKDTIMIATHVDDSIVTGSSPEKLDAFINRLESRFDATAERT